MRLLLVLTSLVTASFAVPSRGRQAHPYRHLFAFGDSYTATSFSTSGIQPTAGNPMGNPQLGSGTYTDGINWIGYLTTKYNNSLILTYDFAVGGATINGSIVSSGTPMDVQVTTQFEPKYSTAPKFWTSADSLFTVFIGINDLFFTYAYGSYPTADAILTNAYYSLLVNLYKTGARNFLFINVPPLDRSPYFIALGTNAQNGYSGAITAYNSALVTMVNKFVAEHSGVRAEIFDNYAYMTAVLDSPTSFGFTDNTCQSLPLCVWQGAFHTMYTFNEIMVVTMASTLAALGW